MEKEKAMAKIGIFYGSTTGNTLKAAELIQKAFAPEPVDLVDVRKAAPQDLRKYDVLILGTSTWHWGGLQDEWAIFEDQLTKDAVQGKKVAFFGLGDQKRYPDHFVDGMGLLYDKIKPLGISTIGMWSKNGYQYEASAAEIDGRLIGLALDEDSEPARTADRIQAWVQQLRKELRMEAAV